MPIAGFYAHHPMHEPVYFVNSLHMHQRIPGYFINFHGFSFSADVFWFNSFISSRVLYHSAMARPGMFEYLEKLMAVENRFLEAELLEIVHSFGFSHIMVTPNFNFHYSYMFSGT